MRREQARAATDYIPKPRLGFIGLGFTGLSRLRTLASTSQAEVVALAVAAPLSLERALACTRGAIGLSSIEDMLDQDLDGLVVSTPTGPHAEHVLAALERGIAVFCEKPLGRSTTETRHIVEVAQKCDKLLGVDLCYRYTDGMRRVRELVQSSALHDVYAAQLGFHNAYGPDKAWVYDPRLLGGGALADLGAHLVDLALWTLDFPNILQVRSRLFAEGRPVSRKQRRAEDYVVADLTADTGAVIRLSCSWRLHVGQDCSFDAAFYGTRGGARFYNLGGSFYDFGAELLSGTSRRTLSAPPDNWQGRAVIRWMQQLSRDDRFDAGALRLLDVARVIDRIYDADC